MARRFPAPWTVIEVAAAYVVVDSYERRLAYVYWDDSELQSASSDKLTKDEARRIAAGIARLPGLVSKSKI